MLQATTREGERNNAVMQPTTAFWLAQLHIARGLIHLA